MTVQRLVWIVVAILFIVVAFTAGIAVSSGNTRRSAVARNAFGPAMMRGTIPMMRNGAAPFGYGAQPGIGRQNGMMGPGRGMMPGYGRGVAPNNRGTAPRFAPNQRRGVPPSNNPGINRRGNDYQRLPRQPRGR